MRILKYNLNYDFVERCCLWDWAIKIDEVVFQQRGVMPMAPIDAPSHVQLDSERHVRNTMWRTLMLTVEEQLHKSLIGQ